MKIHKIARIALAAVTSVGLVASTVACSAQNKADDAMEAGGDNAAKGGLNIVATTGYLGDAVKNIAPEAKVTVLVKPGGDPHTQPLSTKDTEMINKADLVVWTSHDMEHQMMEQLDKLGEKQLPAAEAIPEKDLLPWEEDGKVEGHDPHVWNSPDNWKFVVTAIGEKLGKVDAANAEKYKKNAEAYNAKIDAAKAKAAEKFAKIPKENRVLITGHDAFNYLGKTFDIEIHATDFVSSESQMSAKEIDDLAAMIAQKKVPVIFQDNLSNPQAIDHLKQAVESKGWKVQVSDKELYADSLGEKAPVDTYLGVFEYNADAIVAALTQK